MIVRNARREDISKMQALFTKSIAVLCIEHYSPAQIKAWQNKALNNPQRWEHLLTDNEVYVLDDKNELLGFASVNRNGLIDMFYLHPDFIRRGYARRLYLELEKYAHRQNLAELHSHVSITARPFFLKMGFTVQEKRMVFIGREQLTNYSMIKPL